MFCAPLERTQIHLSRTLRAFHDRVAAHVEAALGVKLASREFAPQVRQPQAPPGEVAYAFEAAFTSVVGLIPLRLVRRPIERALLRKARHEVEKNLSRLAADWSNRIQHVMEELCRQAEAAARAELDALDGLLAQTAPDTPRLQQRMHELAAWPLEGEPGPVAAGQERAHAVKSPP